MLIIFYLFAIDFLLKPDIAPAAAEKMYMKCDTITPVINSETESSFSILMPYSSLYVISLKECFTRVKFRKTKIKIYMPKRT